MSPENQWLEDVFPIEMVPVLGTCEFSGGVVFLFFSDPFLDSSLKVGLQ